MIGRWTGQLTRSELFSGLTHEEVERLGGYISIKTFKRGQAILLEEDSNEYMYVVLEGEAKAFQSTHEGSELILAIHNEGESFGEVALIDSKTMPAAVSATTDACVAIISRKAFFDMLSTNQKIMRNLLGILTGRLRDSWQQIRMLSLKDATERIAALLLSLSRQRGRVSDTGTEINGRLTHQSLADMSGLTRETVTRALDRLKREGRVRIAPSRNLVLTPSFFNKK